MFRRTLVRFIVTDEHLTLLRHLNVNCVRPNDDVWDYFYLVDPRRPLGNSDILCDAIRIIHGSGAVDGCGYYDENHANNVLNLIADLCTVFQIMLDNLSIQAGTYERMSDRYGIDKTRWALTQDKTHA